MQENTTLLKVKSRDNEPDNERPESWKQQRQTLLELENTKQHVFLPFWTTNKLWKDFQQIFMRKKNTLVLLNYLKHYVYDYIKNKYAN